MIRFDDISNDWDDNNRNQIQDFGVMPESFSDDSLPEEKMVLAMSYVKRQEWGEVFDCDTALAKGTLFPVLEKPFLGTGGCSK